VFHAINAVLIPGKGVAAGRRLLGGGGASDAQSMALEANYDQQQEAIWWAANSGTPGSTEAATQEANIGNQLVAIPSWAEEDW
jgi:hypothetical protein